MYLCWTGWLRASPPGRRGIHWGLLGLCMGSVWSISENFAKLSVFVQMVVPSFFMHIKLDNNKQAYSPDSLIIDLLWLF